MKVRYDLLYKNGVKEEVIQEGTKEEHMEIIQTINDAFLNDLHAVLTFGDGEKVGRYVRVSDLSQVQNEILDWIKEGVTASESGRMRSDDTYIVGHDLYKDPEYFDGMDDRRIIEEYDRYMKIDWGVNMAKRMKRKPSEIALLVFDHAERGLIDERETGCYGLW
jgi:hypothetical protein